MADRLPPFSGEEVVKKLERAGWKVSRQKGSHVMMVKPEYQYTQLEPLTGSQRSLAFFLFDTSLEQ